MDVIEREQLFNHVRGWVLEAGALIREAMEKPLTIETKSDPKDLVTEVDRKVELFFTERIKRHYPDHLIISEEGFGDELYTLNGVVWIIDPIDGTMNFVQRKRDFCISIGIYNEGVGEIGLIYDVMANNLYCGLKDGGAFKNNKRLASLDEQLKLPQSIVCFNHHWLCDNTLIDPHAMQRLLRDVRGTRSYGSAALEFAFVAEGSVDAYISMRLQPWDVAAGVILVNEVGGKTTTASGENLNMLTRNPTITCNAAIHKTIVETYLKNALKK